MDKEEAVGRENPEHPTHSLKNFRDRGGSTANVDENKASEPLSPSIWAPERRSSSQLGHRDRPRR